MVWLDPADRNVISEESAEVYLSIQEESGFILQQYQPHLDDNDSYDPGDNRFRIILQTDHSSILIAHSDCFEKILEHWEWIVCTLIPQVQLLDDLPEEEVFQFIILKIGSLKLSAETSTMMPENETSSPESFFKEIYPNLTLISYCNCSLWEDRLFKGILFLNTKHCFFYSIEEKKSLVLPYVEIATLTKQKGGIVPNSIKLVNIHGNQYLFSNLSNMEELFALLNGIWEFSIYQILKSIESDMEELNWELEDDDDYDPPVKLEIPSEFSSWKDPFEFDILSISKEKVLSFYNNAKYQQVFRLPSSEKLITSIECIMEGWGPSYMKDVCGKLYVSQNVIGFNGSDITATILSSEITSIEQRLPDKLIICTESIRFKFSKISKDEEIVKEILNLWNSNWKQNGLLEVSHFNGSIKSQQKISREKQLFFKDVGDISDKQQTEWSYYAKINGHGLVFIKTPELIQLTRRGIPRKYRGEIWQSLSGSIFKKELYPLEYRNIVKESNDETTLASEEIERDLNRTFPEHPFFQKDSGRDLLRRILKSYSFRNPSIGYCQSMNIIAAFQVLFMKEEEAYWMLSSICEDILPDYYVPSMIGCSADQIIFEHLVKEYLPDLKNHFIMLSIPITLITIPWLLCIFVGFLSWESTLRVLDCFFCEGRKILFQIGMSILKIYRSRILSCDDPLEVIDALKNSDVDSNILFKVAFEDFENISNELIDELHKKYRCKVLKDLQSKLQKRKHTAAIQLSKRPYKARRSLSLEHKKSDSPLQSRLLKLGAQTQSTSSLTEIESNSPKSIRKEDDTNNDSDVVAFRSSRHTTISFSSAFKPNEDEVPIHRDDLE